MGEWDAGKFMNGRMSIAGEDGRVVDTNWKNGAKEKN